MSPFLAQLNPVLSWNLWWDARQVLAFHFMVNAVRAGTVVAVMAAGIGWFVVLRRQAFAAHTLAVVGFPGAAGATLLGIGAAWGYFGFCVAAALVIAAVAGPSLGEAFSEESAVIGTVQAFALACGFLFVTLYQGFVSGTIDSLLFGTYLGVTDTQVLVLLAVAVASLVILAVVGRPLFFASVDSVVASARGVPVRLLSMGFLVLLGVATAEASQITGSLLVFALLIMPAATVQQLTSRPAAGLVLSVLLALVVTWVGLGISYFSPYPVGFFITTFAFGTYLLASGSRVTKQWWSRRRAQRSDRASGAGRPRDAGEPGGAGRPAIGAPA